MVVSPTGNRNSFGFAIGFVCYSACEGIGVILRVLVLSGRFKYALCILIEIKKKRQGKNRVT